VGERWPGTIASMNRDLKLLAGAAGVSALGDFLGELPRANGLMETLRALGFTAGPLLGGLLGAAGLLQLALVIDALSFAAVGLAALALRARRRPERTHARVPAREGFAFLARDRALAITLGGAVAALTVFTMSATAEPFFVMDVLGAGSAGYGLLITAWTRGGIVGAAASPVLWTALLGFAFGGVAHGLKNVLLRTLIHERVPEALRGRAFAAYNGARNGAELGALALGGLVVGAFGARVALLASGLGPALIGLACLLFLTTPTLQRRTIDARVQG
jgi:MFS family permease